MSQYITRINTEDGNKQIDYNALANLPDLSVLEGLSDGVLSLDKGGTGASDGATGLQNLFAAGMTILTEGVNFQYGPDLPDAGNPGRIFFKKV